MPTETGNRLAKQGKLGSTLQPLSKPLSPKTVYFTDMHGKAHGLADRGEQDASQIPSIAEPLFLALDPAWNFTRDAMPDLMKAVPRSKRPQKNSAPSPPAVQRAAAEN